ncbi:MAG: hypothetical protein LBJ64_05605 [Deltaproteobacteria bacterium]|nr:hypothetical protein [Deltaproteobacteria bacterium]
MAKNLEKESETALAQKKRAVLKEKKATPVASPDSECFQEYGRKKMSHERPPLKFFAPRDVDSSRVKEIGSARLPNWVLRGDALQERSERLFAGLSVLASALAKKKASQSIIPLLFKAKLDDGAMSKARRAPIVDMLSTRRSGNVAGLSDKYELVARLDSLDEFQTVSERLKDSRRYAKAISGLTGISPFQPRLDIDEAGGKHKAHLIDVQEHDLNEKLESLFEEALRQRQIQFKKAEYAPNYHIYSLKLDSLGKFDSLKKMEIFEVLDFVEPMPTTVLDFGLLDSASLQKAATKNPPEKGDSRFIG